MQGHPAFFVDRTRPARKSFIFAAQRELSPGSALACSSRLVSLGTITTQHFTYLAGQCLEGEGLLQKCGAGFEHSLVHDGVLSVAGKIENLGFRPDLHKSFRELAAADPGHD